MLQKPEDLEREFCFDYATAVKSQADIFKSQVLTLILKDSQALLLGILAGLTD